MYGIFSTANTPPRPGFKFDNQVLDLAIANNLGLFHGLGLPHTVFERNTLNDFIALGKPTWQAVEQRLNELQTGQLPEFDGPIFQEMLFVPLAEVILHLPVSIGDYTDFYAGIHHAENVGRIFRPARPGQPNEPLLPNYRHLPVGYHGRASSVVVSETPVYRPMGQFLQDEKLTFGPTQALDFELELGLIIGQENVLGQPVSVTEAEDAIFGVVLVNDWSARDVQRWEYQPLGPFLGKNFSTSISAWVLPFRALAPFRMAGPTQEPTPLPYLQDPQNSRFSITLQVLLNDTVIGESSDAYLYWSFAQLIAHHTIGGCNLRVGDLLATGTISGPTTGTFGSLLETTHNGTQPIALPDGTTRAFLQNGDRVTLRAWVGNKHNRVDLGEVTGEIQPGDAPN
jgi:fumarylacetoacetase